MNIVRRAVATIGLLFSLHASAAAAIAATPSHLVGTEKPPPRRIVSLAPSVTELLFALGLGDRVVGVTTFCRYPPAALRVTRIGGYLTPNFEALLVVRPDLAVLLPEHDDLRSRVEALGIPVLRVDHNNVAQILESVTVIGNRCGLADAAVALRGELRAGLDDVARTVAGRPPPRVVIGLDRNAAPDGLRSISAAAPGGIYHDLIVRAGGANVVPAGQILHPSLSAEALLQLDPDVIVEFAPGVSSPDHLRAAWRGLPSLRAVRAGRVYVFTQDFLPVPGPRLVRFIGELARALHPDAPWRRP